MADITEERGDRAQLILVAAIVLAVTFVGLAIVVNSAIFSENLATRGDVPGSGEALDFQYEAEQNIGELVEAVNEDEYEEEVDQDILEDAIKTSVASFSLQSGIQQSRRGGVVNVTRPDKEDIEIGTRIAQKEDEEDGPQKFTNGGAKNWMIAEDVTQARNIQFEIEFDALGDSSEPFRFLAEDDDSNEWSMEIFEEDEDVKISIETEDNPDSISCTISDVSDSFSVDVTGATVDGQWCQALERNGTGEQQFWFAANFDQDEEFNLKFENGDQATGTFSMIIKDGEPFLSVVTNKATDVNESSATLNGEVSSEADVGFEYGKAENGLDQEAGPDMQSGSFSKTVENLEPDTDYEFRAFADPDEGDRIKGDVLNFTTGGEEEGDAEEKEEEDSILTSNTAIYSVTVEYTYRTQAVQFETDIRVAPGEVPP